MTRQRIVPGTLAVATMVAVPRFSRMSRPEEVVNMRVDRSRFNWGVLLIVLGGVALAYHRNAVSSSVLLDAWRLWPLIVVGIGLKLSLIHILRCRRRG